VKVDFLYLAMLLVGVIIVVVPFFSLTTSKVATDLHSLYMLVGTIITLIIFIFPTSIQMGGDSFKQAAAQFGLVNVLLGLPMIRATGNVGYAPPIPQMAIGVLAEEAMRIGSALWLYLTFNKLLGESSAKLFAALGSAVVFAALHIYWQPSAWVYTIGLWFVVSIFYLGMGSAVACVGSHLFYDLLAFGYINVFVFFGASIFMLVLSLPLKPKIGVT
jgi:membrane protease YdiL (CAAX protease family)